MQQNYYGIYFLFTIIMIGVVQFSHDYSERINFKERQELRSELRDSQKIIIEQKKRLADLSYQLDILDNTVTAEDKIKTRADKIKEIIKNDVKGITTLNTIAVEVIINADKYDIEPALILAVMKQESAFNHKIISPAGAQGLMQVLPATGRDIKGWLNKSYYNPYKISHNIEFGTYYLAKLLHEYEFQVNDAVMAYNAGPEAVRRFLAGEIKRLPSETIDYEKKVMRNYEFYKESGIQ